MSPNGLRNLLMNVLHSQRSHRHRWQMYIMVCRQTCETSIGTVAGCRDTFEYVYILEEGLSTVNTCIMAIPPHFISDPIPQLHWYRETPTHTICSPGSSILQTGQVLCAFSHGSKQSLWKLCKQGIVQQGEMRDNRYLKITRHIHGSMVALLLFLLH